MYQNYPLALITNCLEFIDFIIHEIIIKDCLAHKTNTTTSVIITLLIVLLLYSVLNTVR